MVASRLGEEDQNTNEMDRGLKAEKMQAKFDREDL